MNTKWSKTIGAVVLSLVFSLAVAGSAVGQGVNEPDGQNNQTGAQGQSGESGQANQTGAQGQSGEEGQANQTGDQGQSGEEGQSGGLGTVISFLFNTFFF